MKPSRKAFTLIEIMIVVTLIGLLVAMAIPSIHNVRNAANMTRFLNDARLFKDAIEVFMLEEGTYPNNSATGVLDPQLEPYIKKSLFEDATPIGGQWDIEVDGSGIQLGVGAVGHFFTNDLLLKLDSKYDDGSLSTGKLQSTAGGYFWVIE